MGQSCKVPSVLQDDIDEDPQRKLIKDELSRSKAEVLMDVPGATVVIIDPDGGEAPVESGRFHLIKLAPPSKLAVFFVGESFGDLAAQGFYYPMFAETPVCLASRKATKGAPGSHVLTMTAGDGDVFGIRLPSPLAEGEEGDGRLEAFVELLNQQCTLQILQDPDFADKIVGHIAHGGKKLIGSVEWATEKMSAHIAKGGEVARSKIGKVEKEVEVGHGTTVAVAGAKFITGTTLAVATAVTDGLMDTAIMLGEEVSKATKKNKEGTRNHTPEGKLVKLSKAAGVAGLQVFDSLSQAGDRLLDEACNETAAVVGHRYGKDASHVAREGMHIAKDVKDVSDMLGKKAVKRLAAKGAMYTAKGIIDGQPVKQSSSQLLFDRSKAAASSKSG